MTAKNFDRTTPQPNPGSDAALDQGCICPVLDNAHGIGYLGIPGQWVFVVGCPLHHPNVEERSDRND